MKWTYDSVGRCFDDLFEKSLPWKGEAERIAFRTDWLLALEMMGWTEKEWEDELALRVEIIQMRDSKFARIKGD